LLERVASLVSALPFQCRSCHRRYWAFERAPRREGPRHERREFPRIPVRLTSAFSGDRVRGEGLMLDLSVGGCRIRSALRLSLGDLVYLRIALPGQEPLELAAVVRSAGPQGIGCKFLRAAHEDGRLAAYLREQEEAAARQETGVVTS
jgi:hypothetical protein